MDVGVPLNQSKSWQKYLPPGARKWRSNGVLLKSRNQKAIHFLSKTAKNEEVIVNEREETGHSTIPDEIPHELWAFPKDFAKSNSSFTRIFALGFRTRVEWKTDGLLQGYNAEFLCGVGAGVFPGTHCVAEWYGLQEFVSVFQQKYWRY